MWVKGAKIRQVWLQCPGVRFVIVFLMKFGLDSFFFYARESIQVFDLSFQCSLLAC